MYYVGGRDVMLSSASVILSADNLSGTISISAIDDVVYEGAESLQLAITSSDEAVRFLPESISVEVNIEDTDCEYMLYMLYDCLGCASCVALPCLTLLAAFFFFICH